MFLNDEPTRMDEFKLNEGDVDRLNGIARRVAEKRAAALASNKFGEIIVWDSYLPLQREYVKYCK